MNITDRAMMTPMSIAPNPTKKICCTSSLRPGMNVPSFMLSTRSNTDPINRPMVTTHTMTHTTEAAASIYFLKASFQIVGENNVTSVASNRYSIAHIYKKVNIPYTSQR